MAEVDTLVEGLGAVSPAEVPSVVVVASEADITEAADPSMAAVTGDPASTLEWAGGATRIMGVTRRTTDTIRITTATILTRTAAVRIPRRQ